MDYCCLNCPIIDPVLIRLGPLAISWYGLMYGAAAISWLLITRSEILRRRGPIPVQALPELFVHGLVGAVIGGRLGYVLLYNLPYFFEKPWEIFAFWYGGMSIHGGFVGMGIGGLVFLHRHSVPIEELADVTFLGIAPGLMLIKIANFINCESFGTATTLPWGTVFPDGGPLPRHPVQLYEAVLQGPILFAILWLVRSRSHQPGDVCNFFLMGYGAFRFLTDYVREPDPYFGIVMGWLSMGQILSLCTIAVGLVCHVIGRRKSKTHGTSMT
ncbi:MAG: prolipoprotein diacylglyceryl transferase [Desulfomonilaceae bacterium]|nr:prolipoprotein diacylglyceryl transferase [Desulfomonilaceae bacterium]